MNSTLFTRAICIGLTALLIGCGNSGARSPQFVVSGDVLFNSEPVPAGIVQFEPDAAQGNRGPATLAHIKNGRFETPSGKGVVGGPYKITITGYDGVPTTVDGESMPEGKHLFAGYSTHLNLPNENTECNFDVPATARIAN